MRPKIQEPPGETRVASTDLIRTIAVRDRAISSVKSLRSAPLEAGSALWNDSRRAVWPPGRPS